MDLTTMLSDINLTKCLACGDKITKGLFCAKHVDIVAKGMAAANAPRLIDRNKLKAEAEARLAEYRKVTKP